MKAEIIGNIGADAVIKDYAGKEYVTFNIADTTYNRTTGQSETTWVSVFWYGNGGALLPYLTKGSKLFVRGNLKVSTYKDQHEQIRQSLTINTTEVQLISSTKERTQQAPTPQIDTTPQQDNDLPF